MKTLLLCTLLILVQCSTAFCMSEAEMRQKLANSGIPLWPANVEADPYNPPYSYLKPVSNNLFQLYVRNRSITNINVLAGMPISDLYLDTPKVKDLTPLASIPLTVLTLICSSNADISPLRGKPLVSLGIGELRVPDLSIIKDMPLKKLWFNPEVVTNGMDVVATMRDLDRIDTSPEGQSWSMKAYTKRLQLWGFRTDSAGMKPASSNILYKPISIRVTTYPGYTTARPWEMIILPSGETHFEIQDYGCDDKKASEPVATLSVEQMSELRKSIIDNNYFSLPPVIGDDIIDASSRSLSIRVGDYQQSITIKALHNRIVSNDPQIVIAKRVVAIWQKIGSLVKIPQNCKEFSDEDQMGALWSGSRVSRTTRQLN